MGFKQLSKNKNTTKTAIKNEEDFINAARGETSLPQAKKIEKRNIQMQLYLNESEMNTLKESATNLGMKATQYVRFKLFSEDKVKGGLK